MTVLRMTAWPVPATPGQAQVRSLVIGAGTPYALAGIEGLDLPAIHSSDAPRAGSNGSLGGLDTTPVRNLVFHMLIHADLLAAGPTKHLLARDLKAAFSEATDDIGLTIQHPELGALLFLGRPRRCYFPVDMTAPWKHLDGVMAQFDALDPLIYSNTIQDAVLPYPTAGVQAGLPFNSALYVGATARPGPAPSGTNYQGFRFGAIGGGAGASGFATLTNNGSAPTAPVSTIYGPTVGPIVLEKVATGEVITLNMNLNAGDFLELDHDLHSAFLNGIANRQDVVDPSTAWWLLPPGPSLIHYRTVGASVGSSADIKWRDAWW